MTIHQLTGYRNRLVRRPCMDQNLKSKQVKLKFLHLGRLNSGLISHIIRSFSDEFVRYIVSKSAPYSMCPPNISTTIDEINIHHKITFPGPARKDCCQQSSLSFGKMFRQSYCFFKPESDGLTNAFFYSHAKLFMFHHRRAHTSPNLKLPFYRKT